MRILITGGAGFIGSSLVHALVGTHEVGIVDDLSSGTVGNIHPAAWFRTYDITDSGLADLVSEFGPDAVVHLAAQSSVPVSVRDPERDWLVNVDGTRAVAAAAREAGARRVISASSAAVYGDPASVPLRESAQKRPLNPYGTSKLAAEEALAAELAGTAVDFASMRFANVYGPRQDAVGEGGVVAAFCDRLARGEKPTIFGSGRQTRDFVYVGDVVNALIMALDSDAQLREGSGDGPAYNVGTGTETSVEDLARTLRPIAGFYGEFIHAPAREGDVERSALDASKARDVFAWDARVPLEVGLTQTFRWFAAQR